MDRTDSDCMGHSAAGVASSRSEVRGLPVHPDIVDGCAGSVEKVVAMMRVLLQERNR